MMTKTEFKYGDTIPPDVRRLERETDGDVFERTLIRKQWVKVGGYNGGTTYENDGSLLWEWAQCHPLRAAKSDLEKAKDYFNGNKLGDIKDSISLSWDARRHAAVIVADAIA